MYGFFDCPKFWQTKRAARGRGFVHFCSKVPKAAPSHGYLPNVPIFGVVLLSYGFFRSLPNDAQQVIDAPSRCGETLADRSPLPSFYRLTEPTGEIPQCSAGVQPNFRPWHLVAQLRCRRRCRGRVFPIWDNAHHRKTGIFFPYYTPAEINPLW